MDMKMCNLHSFTKGQAAIIALVRDADRAGNAHCELRRSLDHNRDGAQVHHARMVTECRYGPVGMLRYQVADA
jgi:hypothetical protein